MKKTVREVLFIVVVGHCWWWSVAQVWSFLGLWRLFLVILAMTIEWRLHHGLQQQQQQEEEEEQQQQQRRQRGAHKQEESKENSTQKKTKKKKNQRHSPVKAPLPPPPSLTQPPSLLPLPASALGNATPISSPPAGNPAT